MGLQCVVYRIPESLYMRLKGYAERSGLRVDDVAVFALVFYLEKVGWLYEKI